MKGKLATCKVVASPPALPECVEALLLAGRAEAARREREAALARGTEAQALAARASREWADLLAQASVSLNHDFGGRVCEPPYFDDAEPLAWRAGALEQVLLLRFPGLLPVGARFRRELSGGQGGGGWRRVCFPEAWCRWAVCPDPQDVRTWSYHGALTLALAAAELGYVGKEVRA